MPKRLHNLVLQVHRLYDLIHLENFFEKAENELERKETIDGFKI